MGRGTPSTHLTPFGGLVGRVWATNIGYIRKYVIILGGDIPVDVPPTKILGGCVPGIPGGVDASVWVRVQAQKHTTFVGALYHPPKPQYLSAALLDYIEAGIDAVTTACPSATIVLAGDFNSLNDTEVVTRGALLSTCIVDRPTRGNNTLK